MSFFDTPSNVVVTCQKRLSPYLETEVAALGFPIESSFVTGVKTSGTLKDCIRLNLHLRCASQVLYSLKTFQASHADDVYESLVAMPWEDILFDDGYFSVTSNVNHPTINNSMFANLRVKDAIVDRLRRTRNIRPQTGSELEGAVVHLFWKMDNAEVFLDTSGASLARHGYRKNPGTAPMLEGLAAGTIYATQWNSNSAFVNPMCGSGTLAIEAALIATNRVPGLFRNKFAFMHLQGYKAEWYEEEDAKLEDIITEPENLRIIASDINPRAIENSKLNAIAAGVKDLVHFELCDFTTTTIPQENRGVVMLNPEYGARLGDVTELESTYGQIGDFLKQQCRGYWGYIFTGNLDLAKKIGLKPKRRVEFYNSQFDCRLLEYELYEGTKRSFDTPANGK